MHLPHGHHDHGGSALYFQEKGAKIYCSEADSPEMIRGGMLISDTPWGEEWEFPACTPDVQFKDGDVLTFEDFELKVIGAPGHSAGSVLFEMMDGEKDIVFSGDCFSCDGERGELVIVGWKGSMDYSAKDYQATFEKIYKTLNPDYILGGHGIPCVRDGKRVIRNAYRKFLMEYR